MLQHAPVAVDGSSETDPAGNRLVEEVLRHGIRRVQCRDLRRNLDESAPALVPAKNQ